MEKLHKDLTAMYWGLAALSSIMEVILLIDFISMNTMNMEVTMAGFLITLVSLAGMLGAMIFDPIKYKE